MTLHLPSDTSLLRFNQNAMTLANEHNHTELKKFFADHLGRIHKDSGTMFAPQSSFLVSVPATRPITWRNTLDVDPKPLGTAPATVPDQVASDKEQDQTKKQTEMSEFSNVCEKQSASCGLKRSRVSIQQVASAHEPKFSPNQQANPSQEATSADLKSSGLGFPYHRIDQSHFSDLLFTSLSDAIRLWEDSRHEKVRNSLPKFNILATVIKWSEPRATKGVNSFKTYSIGN
jgi:hypothetical protein